MNVSSVLRFDCSTFRFIKVNQFSSYFLFSVILLQANLTHVVFNPNKKYYSKSSCFLLHKVIKQLSSKTPVVNSDKPQC